MCIGNYGNRIFSIGYITRNIEIGRSFGILVITDRMSVRKDIIGPAHGIQTDENLAIDPLERHGELPTIDRSPHIVRLPLRNRNGLPCRHVHSGFCECRVELHRAVKGFHLPLSVQTTDIERMGIILLQGKIPTVVAHDPGSGRLPAEAHFGRIIDHILLCLRNELSEQSTQTKCNTASVFHLFRI